MLGQNTDEFPALSSASNTASKKRQKSYASTVQTSFDQPTAEEFPALTNNIVNSEVRNDHSNDSNELNQFIARNSGQRELDKNDLLYTPLSQESKTTAKLTEDDRYGLLGLLDAIRGIEPDQRMLSIGYDFKRLGLGLDRPHSIYSTFLSPWTDDHQEVPVFNVEPGYYTPPAYQIMKASPPTQERIKSFPDEILFYGFYGMPKDIVQEVAARELYERHWRYNKVMGLWITKEVDEKGRPNQPLRHDFTVKSYDHDTFIVFDPATWKKNKRELTIFWDAFEIKL